MTNIASNILAADAEQKHKQLFKCPLKAELMTSTLLTNIKTVETSSNSFICIKKLSENLKWTDSFVLYMLCQQMLLTTANKQLFKPGQDDCFKIISASANNYLGSFGSVYFGVQFGLQDKLYLPFKQFDGRFGPHFTHTTILKMINNTLKYQGIYTIKYKATNDLIWSTCVSIDRFFAKQLYELFCTNVDHVHDDSQIDITRVSMYWTPVANEIAKQFAMSKQTTQEKYEVIGLEINSRQYVHVAVIDNKLYLGATYKIILTLMYKDLLSGSCSGSGSAMSNNIHL